MIRESRGKRPGFYGEPSLDQFMSMLMVLAGEISVLADHIDGIERVAASQGLDLRSGLAGLELDEGALAEREERRQALFRRLFYLLRKEASEVGAGEDQAGYEATLADIAARSGAAS